jgi:hypothetical protein
MTSSPTVIALHRRTNAMESGAAAAGVAWAGHTTSADIAAFVAERVGPEYVPRAYATTKVRPAPVKRPSALPSA